MAFQFNGFRATKPVVRLVDDQKIMYEVFFALYDDSRTKRNMRYSKNVNSIPVAQRKDQATALAKVLWEGLQMNWNPLHEKYPNFNKKEKPVLKLTVTAALEFAIKLKIPALSKYSAYDYNAAVRMFQKAAKQIDIGFCNIDELERRDVRLLIDTAKLSNSWSNKSRNKYLAILKSLLSVLVDRDLIKINPAHSIKNEVEEIGMGYKRLTDPEKEIIALRLLKTAPNFFDYLMFIYQSGIRRTELLQVKIVDINLTRRLITIRSEVAKTNTAREIPITDDLYDILMRREVYQLPHNWYLFSQKFLCGDKPVHPNTPTNRWRQLVIKSPEFGGLGIDCKMYSLKHKGADDKIKAGLDLDVLRTLYGHRSKQMTEIYAREVKNQYAQKIIDQSPVFAKVVEIRRQAK